MQEPLPDQQVAHILDQQACAVFCPAGGPVGKDLTPAKGTIGILDPQEHGGPVAHRAETGDDGTVERDSEDVGIKPSDGFRREDLRHESILFMSARKRNFRYSFTEAMKVAGWCERHYIDLMPHNPLGPVCTAATIHMAAAVPNFSWAETQQGPTEDLGFHDPELFPVQIPLEGITCKVPDRPGLGVEVDEDKIRATTPQHVEPPRLWRPDGSVTN